MADPIVTGFKGAKFKNVDFARYLTSWNDTRVPSIAQHKYIKRDGGEMESMGRRPFETRMHLVFIGSKWMDTFLNLQAAIDDDPIGKLTHPIYGDMNVACLGYQGAHLDIENAPNLYELELSFIESAVDSKVKSESADSQSPSEHQQNISTFNTGLITTVANLSEAAIVATAQLVSASTSFATSAIAAAATLIPDPTLELLLAATDTATDAAIAAMAASTTGSTSDVTNSITQAEQVLDACNQLADAIRAQRPVMFLYTVSVRTNLTNLALAFYGKDGSAREAEILTNNPQLQDPGYIPQGTQLWMAVATV